MVTLISTEEMAFLCRFGMLMRICTPKDTGADVLITETTTRLYVVFQIIKTTKMNSIYRICLIRSRGYHFAGRGGYNSREATV